MTKPPTISGCAGEWRPTHVHADGGEYRFIRHVDGRTDSHEPWYAGVLYEGADGRQWWTGNDRWFDRFTALAKAAEIEAMPLPPSDLGERLRSVIALFGQGIDYSIADEAGNVLFTEDDFRALADRLDALTLRAGELETKADVLAAKLTVERAYGSELAARIEEALTPSADTKAAYMGEFSFPVVMRLGREEETRRLAVPWDTIKQIMAAIRARSLLNPTPKAGRTGHD